MLPADPSDRALLAAVHPSDWQNPEPARRYDLVVLGGGTGGLVTAAIAAGLGARVALVERERMGGDCLNVGCVPSKALINAADVALAGGDIDFETAMTRLRQLRLRLSERDSAARFRELGVDVFLGHGAFVGRDAVEAAGARLRFRRAVIATGSRPVVPSIPGLTGVRYYTNETIFDLTERPARLAILGAGSIGCELGQAFARLGSRVILLDQSPRVLANEDPEASALVAAALQRDGVQLRLGVEVSSVEGNGATQRIRFRSADATQADVEADAILVAAGRIGNVEELGLEAAGVRTRENRIVVDPRLRTSNRRIFAVGDVMSPTPYTHAADAQARLVVANALFGGLGGGRHDRLVVPRCTYTRPEVAQVGITSAASADGDVQTITVPLAEVDRAVLEGQTDGFLRVHLTRRGQILGATLVAAHAGEMISEITLAMTAGLRLGQIGSTIHPYPTQAEVFRKAADQWQRERFTPGARRLMERYFKLFR
ncbi:MAG TPA: FAD-containing oxidoreductase [Gemmatimonadales bacterium]|nr:FAD-containing oxidoreductase [Gemmatimonadales bacterium]